MSFWRCQLGRIDLYDLLLPVGILAAAPGYLARSLTQPEYRAHFSERLGIVPIELAERLRLSARPPVWIQAVSVGEVFLAASLIDALDGAWAGRPMDATPRVVLSSTTPAGRASAANLRSDRLAGVSHFPIDWSPFITRWLDTVRPCAFVSMETELWPGLLRQCARRGIPAALANGRLSQRSCDRYRRFGWLFREPLQAVKVACMQTEDDASRARAIGIPADRVVVTGNMKFDAGATGKTVAQDLRARLGLPASGTRQVVVAGSTSAGEEELLLDAMSDLARNGARAPLLILAPRHPERFEEVARMLERRGAVFARRSESRQAAASRKEFDVLLLDTLGELASVYGLADAAYVGGSLVRRGGQNPIEPAALGVPVVFGPHTANFAAVTEDLIRAGAAFRVADAQELAASLGALLADAEARNRAGAAGRALVESNRGATGRTVTCLLRMLERQGGAVPRD